MASSSLARGPVEVLAERLAHPEGPDILPDGGVVIVESYLGTVSTWREEEGLRHFADCGGAPIACVTGSDGGIYLTQGGSPEGMLLIQAGDEYQEELAARSLPPETEPSIQRVTGPGIPVETIADRAGELPFRGTNDLAWGADGRLYFTDSGDWDEAGKTDPGYIYAIDAEGRAELAVDAGPNFASGLAGERDGSIVWGESDSRRIRRLRPDGRIEEVCRLAEGHMPEGIAIDAHDNLWIAAFDSGLVDVVAPDGSPVGFVEVGGRPINCALDDHGYLYLTDYGTVPNPDDPFATGRLLRVAVDARGFRPRGTIR